MRSRKQLDLLQRQKITEIITASWPHLILLILCLLGRARSILWGAEEVCTLAEAILHFSPALQKNWGNLSSRLHCRDLCSTEFHGSFDESCFFSLKFWWIWPFISNALYDISVSCTFSDRVMVFYFCWIEAGFGLVRYTIHFTSAVRKTLKLFSQNLSSPEKPLIAWLFHSEAL